MKAGGSFGKTGPIGFGVFGKWSMRVLMILAVLGGCSKFPDVDAASPDLAGPAPSLLPLEEILAGREPVAEARGDALAARASALRGRANP